MLKELELIGRGLGHVGLEGMQDSLVVHHAQASVLQVSVIVTEVDFLHGGQICITPKVDHPQGLRRNPHIAVFQFIAVRPLVVEGVTDTDVRSHVL